jgi:hypothetical protein
MLTVARIGRTPLSSGRRKQERPMNSMTNTPAWSVLTHPGSAHFLKAGGYSSLLIG